MKILKVLVEDKDPAISKMFRERGFDTTDQVNQADLICFSGGADVSPFLYNEENTHSYTDINRDFHCIGLYKAAQVLNIPCVGICRGGQFINVMRGGSMIQDYAGHGIQGHHKIHVIHPDFKNWDNISVTSVHHQIMVPPEDSQLIAVRPSKMELFEVEIVGHPETDEHPIGLSFQSHPEYNYSLKEETDFFFHLIEERMLPYEEGLAEAV